MEDVAPVPTTLVASLQWEPPQCARVRWTYGREREVEQREYREARWNWTLEGGEEWPVVSGQPRHLGPW